MNIRDALIYQSPSLELQRAAADEIAALDGDYTNLCKALAEANIELYDLRSYLEAHDLTQEFEEWLARNTEE